mmetsp:Transcript_13111/g.25433  ORF Transcript_13111/g.25433 Transcript_13111/m.25433 type:complete len:224 (+) Transcript_13111:259-930(+)
MARSLRTRRWGRFSSSRATSATPSCPSSSTTASARRARSRSTATAERAVERRRRVRRAHAATPPPLHRARRDLAAASAPPLCPRSAGPRSAAGWLRRLSRHAPPHARGEQRHSCARRGPARCAPRALLTRTACERARLCPRQPRRVSARLSLLICQGCLLICSTRSTRSDDRIIWTPVLKVSDWSGVAMLAAVRASSQRCVASLEVLLSVVSAGPGVLCLAVH